MQKHEVETMAEKRESKPPKNPGIRDLPRNVWAVGLTSFFMDISSEMVINILPLFLANVLWGCRPASLA